MSLKIRKLKRIEIFITEFMKPDMDDCEVFELPVVEPRRVRLSRKNFDYNDSPKSFEKSVWNGSDSVTSLSPAEIPAASGRLKSVCFVLLTLLVVLMTASGTLISVLVSEADFIFYLIT